MDYLFDLLNKVASNQHYTKMTGRNLAIVFATNLVSQTLPPQDYMRLSFEGGAVFEFVRLAVEEYHQFKFLIK